MIIREREDAFVMIEQDHHAFISGKLYDYIQNMFPLHDNYVRESVRSAIYQHDIGWAPFDASPIWNDEQQQPFDFITMPNAIKSVLYKNGVDIVEKDNPYAALLCSYHYIRFLQNSPDYYSKEFVQSEKLRQKDIIQAIKQFNQADFLTYYELIQFFDNLSLYICLHELNPSKDEIHFFFKNGIQLPKLYGGGSLHINWSDHDITLDTQLFTKPVPINLQQKIVQKSSIYQQGILDAWHDTPYETIQLTVK